MIEVVIELSMTKNNVPADAVDVAQWVGEALNNPDVRDSRCVIVVHTVNVDAK